MEDEIIALIFALITIFGSIKIIKWTNTEEEERKRKREKND